MSVEMGARVDNLAKCAYNVRELIKMDNKETLGGIFIEAKIVSKDAGKIVGYKLIEQDDMGGVKNRMEASVESVHANIEHIENAELQEGILILTNKTRTQIA